MNLHPILVGSLLGLLALPSLAPPTGAQECGTGCQVLPRDDASGARFGSSVLVRDAVVAVGSPEGDSVTIFDWKDTMWERTQSLPCPDGSGLFGLSIALHEDHLAVGAPLAGRGGLVLRFQRTNDSFSWVQPRLAPDAPEESFGWSVAMDGEYLVVGAPRAAGSRGKVYIFDQDGQLLGNLSGLAAGDQFGISVALDRRSSGGTPLLAVGSPFAERTGAVYVYDLKSGLDQPFAVLRPSDGVELDAFGFAVAVDRGTVAVGSPQHDQRGSNSGAVYFYSRDGGAAAPWKEFKTTGNLNQTRVGDQFGIAVALQGEVAIVGARRHDGAAEDGGAAVRLERIGSTWSETQRWFGEGKRGAELGIAVAVDGVNVLAGAYLANDGAGAAYALGRETDLGIESVERLRPDPALGDLHTGEEVVYKVEVKNETEEVVSGARLRFNAGANLVGARWLESCEDSVSEVSNALAITELDPVAAGAVQERCFASRVACQARGEIHGNVRVTLPVGIFDFDVFGGSNQAQISGSIEDYLRVSIPDMSNPGTIVPGEVASFVIVVENKGAASDATLTATFDADLLSSVKVTCRPDNGGSCCSEPGTCLPTSGSFTDTVSLEEEGRIVYRVRARVGPQLSDSPMRLEACVQSLKSRCTEPQFCAEKAVSVAKLSCPFGDACDGEFQIVTTDNVLYPAIAGNLRELALVWLDSPANYEAPPTEQRIVGRHLFPEGKRGKADLGQELGVSAQTGFFRRSAIDMDAAGNFVVVWESFDFSDPLGHNLRARRFKGGTALSDEFMIAGSTGEYQLYPDLSLSPDGGFIVVWAEGLPPDIVGRRFSSGGEPQGSVFVINTYTTGPQSYPAIATGEEGNFVVVWTSGYLDGFGLDGSVSTIRGRRFAPDGRPRGDEFTVNESTTFETEPDVDVDRSGDFVVVWSNDVLQTTGYLGRSIQGRRFSSDGRAQGPVFRINANTKKFHRRPRVAAGIDSSFLVVWERFSPDRPGFDGSVRGRRLGSAGTVLGNEFALSQSTSYSKANPAVTQAADGFFVVWSSDATEDAVAMPSLRGKRIALDQDHH